MIYMYLICILFRIRIIDIEWVNHLDVISRIEYNLVTLIMLYSVIYQNLIIIFYNIRLIFLFLLYKAYDGSLSNDRLLDVLCGVQIKELLSVSNVVYVRLYMKTAGVNHGFLITYSQGMYNVM